MDHQELARAADAALVCRSPRRRGVADGEQASVRGERHCDTSEEELRRLVSAGLLTEQELHRVAPLRFGPMRCKFARAQLFWQSFPSSGGEEERSTYLFTYLRPSEQMPGARASREPPRAAESRREPPRAAERG